MATDPFEELRDRLSNITLDYLEMMAAAYLKETNLKPSEVELVMQMDFDTYRWWFRKRTHEPVVSIEEPADV